MTNEHHAFVFCHSQGFYVTVDFHFEQPGLQNNAGRFAAEWRRFWSDLVSLPTYRDRLSGRVFPELANEWDKYGCRWDSGTSSKVTGRLICGGGLRRRVAAALNTVRPRRSAGDS